MEGWVSTELGQVDFKDKRLNDRFNILVEQLSSKPTASIPEACEGWGDTKAAYRFFDNPKVTRETILEKHYKSTIDRIEKEDTILVLQDTTNIDFSTHLHTKGLGILTCETARGIKLHSAMVATLDGIPQGLVHQEAIIQKYVGGKHDSRLRGRKIEDKDSHKWLNTVRQVGSRVSPDKKVVVIGDRESDVYELFSMERRAGIDILARIYHNRLVNNKAKYLFTTIDRSKCQGTIKIKINRGNNRKSREAVLKVKYLAIEFLPSNTGYNYGRGYKPVTLTAVEAIEINPPKGEERMHWRLLTTLSADSFEMAVKIIDLYSYRWLIERYHFTLKSGCKVEDLQLETSERLLRALAVYSVVAWRVLWMTYEMRANPEVPCTEILKMNEWKALACFLKKAPNPPGKIPTLQEAITEIAKLGGFLGRKGDKNPGVKTLWRGLRRLDDIVAMWKIMGGY